MFFICFPPAECRVEELCSRWVFVRAPTKGYRSSRVKAVGFRRLNWLGPTLASATLLHPIDSQLYLVPTLHTDAGRVVDPAIFNLVPAQRMYGRPIPSRLWCPPRSGSRRVLCIVLENVTPVPDCASMREAQDSLLPNAAYTDLVTIAIELLWALGTTFTQSPLSPNSAPGLFSRRQPELGTPFDTL